MSREIFVPGRPVPQGSKMPGRMVEVAHTRLRIWRESIGWRVKAAGWHRDLLTGPVRLELRFVLPVVASASERYWAWSRRSGDLDKLVRAVGDALTGLAYIDDARVVQLHASKHHGSEPGVLIRVEPITEETHNHV